MTAVKVSERGELSASWWLRRFGICRCMKAWCSVSMYILGFSRVVDLLIDIQLDTNEEQRVCMIHASASGNQHQAPTHSSINTYSLYNSRSYRLIPDQWFYMCGE
jgi:hypothetical protein